MAKTRNVLCVSVKCLQHTMNLCSPLSRQELAQIYKMTTNQVEYPTPHNLITKPIILWSQ